MTDDNGKNDWPAVFVTDTDEWHRYGKHFFYLCRLLFYLIGITAVIGVVFGLRDVLLPVGISMILAYLLDPVIDWFEDRKVPRPLGIVIVLLLGTFALVAFVLFLYPLLQRHVLEIAGKNNISLLGPNVLGLINTENNMNASFASKTPEEGNISFMSQSGAFCTAILDYAKAEHIGFRHFVSL